MTKGAALSVCLFGASILRISGSPRNLGISGATRDLLHYLLIHAGREVRREYLADLFWARSSPSRQRSALNSAVWRIKRQIQELPGIALHGEARAIRLEVAPHVVVDARELTEAVQCASQARPVIEAIGERLSRALDATDAPFLDGVVEPWALAERERLLNLRLRGLTILMRWRGEQKRYEDALEIGRQLRNTDPFRETVQCELMWLYVLNGQRTQALRQYREYEALLKAELDIEPMPETRALYDHILRDLDCGARSRQNWPAATARAAQNERQKLDAMLGAIERSRRDLYQALRQQLN